MQGLPVEAVALPAAVDLAGQPQSRWSKEMVGFRHKVIIKTNFLWLLAGFWQN